VAIAVEPLTVTSAVPGRPMLSPTTRLPGTCSTPPVLNRVSDPSFTVVVPDPELADAPAKVRAPGPALVRPPVRVTTPLRLSDDVPSTATVAVLAIVIAADHVLAPDTLSRAPMPPAPVPLRVRGSATVRPPWNCSV